MSILKNCQTVSMLQNLSEKVRCLIFLASENQNTYVPNQDCIVRCLSFWRILFLPEYVENPSQVLPIPLFCGIIKY